MSEQLSCHYCSKQFKNYELRPYGPGGAFVCFPCGTSPENNEASKAEYLAQLDAAIEVAGDSRVIVIGEHTGPRPLIPKSLV